MGDHLLAGLEQLLPLIVPNAKGVNGSLAQAVAAKRGMAAPTEADPLCTTDMLFCFGAPPADGFSIPLKEAAPPLAAELNGKDSPNEGKVKVRPEFVSVWDEAVATYRAALQAGAAQKAGAGSILLYLCWRLGRECGTVQQLLSDADISWGTYPDAMGTHCNAHVNNMVVLPSSTVSATSLEAPFLAPVDFDMAFTKESFLFEGVATYAHFAKTWDELVKFESEGFFTTLAGSDFASTGVANSLAEDMQADPRRIAVRDTIASSYRSGLEQPMKDPNAPSEGGEAEAAALLRAGCDALVRLALVLTVNDIA